MFNNDNYFKPLTNLMSHQICKQKNVKLASLVMLAVDEH